MRIKITVMILLLIAVNHSAMASPVMVVGRNEPVHGLYQSTYANMWWQWAVSMPKSESPVMDTLGIKCDVNQTGPVWFLAGGYGTSKIERKCSIPSDKYIFFPVINMLDFPQNAKTNISCKSAKMAATLNNQYLVSFKVIVDHHTFVNPALYRQGSKKCFNLAARKPAGSGFPSVYPSATDGYWIMLRPLSVGTHDILFQARYDNPGISYGEMSQDIEYVINVYKPQH